MILPKVVLLQLESITRSDTYVRSSMLSVRRWLVNAITAISPARLTRQRLALFIIIIKYEIQGVDGHGAAADATPCLDM
jgi:hypothetical protein